MRGLVTLAISAALILPGMAAAKDKPPVSLAKTSKWEINYDDDSCHLFAKFGEGDQAVIINLTRFQPGDPFDLTLYGKDFETKGTSATVKIGFGVNPPTESHAVAGKSSSSNLPVLILTSERLDGFHMTGPGQQLPPVAAAQEAKANVVDLTLAGGKHFRLETGSFAAPMQAMRTCIADLVKKWGYDPAQQAALRSPPTPTKSPASWVQSGDYPTNSLREGHAGLVQFRLDIDESGKIAGCYILHRTKPDDFADLTCNLMTKRAKFTPALDSGGKPVRSFFVSKVRFVIPD